MSRRRHDREITRLHLRQLAERARWTRDAADHAVADVAARLRRIAAGHDADGKHLLTRSSRPVDASKSLSADGHFAVRNNLLDIARDITGSGS